MFEEIKEKLQEIIEIAESCPERYRDKCFEILLKALIDQTIHSVRKTPSIRVTSVETELNVPVQFKVFLETYKIEMNELKKLIDFETGEILLRNLPKKHSDASRLVTALIAVWNAYKEGKFYAPKDKIEEELKKLGISTQNLKRDLKNTKFENYAVFKQTQEGWNLIIPSGEKWIVGKLKEIFSKETE